MSFKRQGSVFGDGAPATRPGMSDAPTNGDRLRIRLARRQARAFYDEVEASHGTRLLAALRIEVGATVRSTSPLLKALLATQGLTLEQGVALIQPARFWPRRLTPSNQLSDTRSAIRNPLWRYYMAKAPASHRMSLPRHARTFYGADGNYVTIQVVDHSLEVEAKIGPVWIETRFGELRVQLDEALPDAIAISSVGRLIEEIVDHHAWRGRGWRIIEVEEPAAIYFGQTLIVAAESAPYRVIAPQHATTDSYNGTNPTP